MAGSPNGRKPLTEVIGYGREIKADVKFWNGDPLTSADVVNALNYYRTTGSYVATELASAKSAAAAVSSKFTWPDYNPWYWDGAYLLGIKAVSSPGRRPIPATTALSFAAELLARLLFRLSSFRSAVAAHGLRG